jgi:3-phosphoshikimate 1-carboxyvinyltransferase
VQAWRIAPAKRVRGVWRPPGDKSITHRAVILGLLAHGTTEIEGFLESDDCLRTLQMAQQLGAQAERIGASHWRITGRGGQPLQEPTDMLDAGNSGTTARLMAGVLASYPIFGVLTGDESLRRRPMRRVVEPLQRMGARIDGREGQPACRWQSAAANCAESTTSRLSPARRSNRACCWRG